MARVLIAAFGSRGDVMPLTDVGIRLQDAGHEVVMTSVGEYVDEIVACGLQARTIEWELDTDDDIATTNPMKLAMQAVGPSGMRQVGDSMLKAVADVPADILLLSPFAELAGHPLAEARGIPSIGLRMQPLSTTAMFPPSLFGAWSAGRALNRAAGRFGTALFDRVYGKTIAGFRDQLDLPHASQRSLRRQRTDAEWPILHGFSPSIVARPQDWRSGLEVVGYWWPRHNADWEPSGELVRFLESGPPPVYLGLGSLMLPDKDVARISTLMQEALAAVGVRGVIQSGGAGLHAVGDDVLTISTVPHDWLFSRVAAVVHSCGAGTTAAGLRAGVPTVGVPSPGGDQPFWARRLTELGVSSSTILRTKLTAKRLASAIESALDNDAYRIKAKEMAAQISMEDGSRAVLSTVEKLAT